MLRSRLNNVSFIYTTVNIEGTLVTMLVDSGSSAPFMPLKRLHEIKPIAQHHASDTTFCTANGQTLGPHSFVEVRVTSMPQVKLWRLCFFDNVSSTECILGLDWMEAFSWELTRLNEPTLAMKQQY